MTKRRRTKRSPTVEPAEKNAFDARRQLHGTSAAASLVLPRVAASSALSTSPLSIRLSGSWAIAARTLTERDRRAPTCWKKNIDALYFTVATLTTTGYGDITMTTPGGKLLSVFIMVVGVALFVQLARAIFQPLKVQHKCSECGLTRHEPEATHCKHCGEPLRIETEGTPAE